MRCEKCGHYTRPDIAVAKNEDRCRCDPVFEHVYSKFQQMLKTNDECIKQLVATQFAEWDDVLVTGTILSEKGRHSVVDLEAVVSTVYDESHPDYDYFKVWPKNDDDPQLPQGHNGKLWFSRSEAKVVVTSSENGEQSDG